MLPRPDFAKEFDNLRPFKIGLIGKTETDNIFGFVVGAEIRVTWEITNLDSRTFPGGTLVIVMAPPNGQYVQFAYSVKSLKPVEKDVKDQNQNGSPLTTNVLAPGFTLFSAEMIMAQPYSAEIYSPPGELRVKGTSFHSLLGKSKEEFYAIIGLYLASVGLVITSIISALQLLHDLRII